MGLRSDIQTDVAAAFNTDLADAVHTLEYHSIVVGDLDPATGTFPSTVTTHATRGVVELTQSRQTDQNGKPTAGSVLILQNELSVTPLVDDELIYSSERYVVTSVEEDAALATWTLQVRHG
jgi:hypothetical protein